MFQLPPPSGERCPFRDLMHYESPDSILTAFEVLGLSSISSDLDADAAWETTRKKATAKCGDLPEAQWNAVLNIIDQAYMLIADSQKRAAYRNRLKIKGIVREPATPPQDEGEPKSESEKRYQQRRRLSEHDGLQHVKAVDSQTNREVIIRRLRSAHHHDVVRVSALQKEAAFLSRTPHPNLIEIYSVSSRRRYYVTESLPHSLKDAFSVDTEGRFAPNDVREVLRQMLQVLGRIHDSGYIHGGISQSDFRVSDAGVVKLVSAPRPRNAALRLPAKLQICVAPELLHPDEFGDLSVATDFYMLGFLVCEMLLGERMAVVVPALRGCTKDTNDAFLWHASEAEEFPSLQSIDPDLPEDLCRAVDRMCRKPPSERPRSVDEILSLLSTRDSAIPSVSPADGFVAQKKKQTPKSQELAERVTNVVRDPGAAWKNMSHIERSSIVGGLAVLLVACLFFSSPPAPSMDDSKRETVGAWEERIADSQTVEFGEVAIAEAFEPEDEDSNPPPVDLDLSQPESIVKDVAAKPVATKPGEVVSTVEAQETRIPEEESTNAVANQEAHEVYVPHHRLRTFAAGQHATKADHQMLAELLLELADSEDHQTQQEIMRRMQDVAPKDPRPHLAYWIVRHYSDLARPELERAIALTRERKLPYIQPLRLAVEADLQTHFRNALLDLSPDRRFQVVDRVLARLSAVERAVGELPSPSEADFFWVGKVYGCLLSVTRHDRGCHLAVEREHRRLLRGLNAFEESSLRNGMTFSEQEFDSGNDAIELFPPTFRLEVLMCRETLPQSSVADSPQLKEHHPDSLVADQ